MAVIRTADYGSARVAELGSRSRNIHLWCQASLWLYGRLRRQGREVYHRSRGRA